MIDEKTTLGEIASILYKQAKDDAIKDAIKHTVVQDNFIKATVFNSITFAGETLVTIVFSINDVKYEFKDLLSPMDMNNEKIKKYFVADGVLITESIFNKVKGDFNLRLVDALKNNKQ